ncbi:Ubiquitin-related modifier like protein [Plasmodiophora brassicae]|uniref:Ubiquitin-related modifier 1 homolog n=1 Tax=Plasmodiophora brassicae TaxID=37360 RepID=A8E072_PLABS|nr:hypothetical protein [Plasmodiophora brassicae]CAM98702.2 hypothetical protein [Plasmodiophora brassicae]CEP02230.1 hypothetical protein PBRA_002496 [Plasmodiophora brassicae]
MQVLIDLGGGLDVLCGSVKQHVYRSDDGDSTTMHAILEHVKTNVIRERSELFIQRDTVRPGILVLINDADWELEDGIDSTVRDGDRVTFISTLHGG